MVARLVVVVACQVWVGTEPHGAQLTSTFLAKRMRGCASSDKERCARGRVTQISCSVQVPRAYERVGCTVIQIMSYMNSSYISYMNSKLGNNNNNNKRLQLS